MIRSSIALIFVVVAGLLTLPASLAAWEQRVLMNEDRFVQVGNDVLEKEAVQRELSRVIAADISRAVTSPTGISDLLGGGSLAKQMDDILNSALGIGPGEPSTITTGDQTLDDLLGSFFGAPTTPGSNATPSVSGSLDSLLGSIFGGPTPTPSSQSGVAIPTILPGVEINSLIQPITDEVVRELPNTPVADAALELTHEVLVTAIREDVVRPENDDIVLDVGDGVSQLMIELGLASSRNELPADLGQIVLLKKSDMAAPFDLARWFDGRAFIFALLPTLVLVAGLALAKDRPRFLVMAGAGLAVAAVLWIVLMKFLLKDWMLDRAVQETEARAAGDAAYDVIIATFVQQELLFLGLGVVVLAAGVVLTLVTKKPRPAPPARPSRPMRRTA